MKLYPPPRICQPKLFIFPRFFCVLAVFVCFLPLFSRFSKQKLSTAAHLRIVIPPKRKKTPAGFSAGAIGFIIRFLIFLLCPYPTKVNGARKNLP